MPWAVAAAAVAAGGAIYSADQSKSAADTQAKGAQAATNTQQGMFNQTQANMNPYLNAGQLSLQQLMQGMGIGPQQLGPTTGIDYTNNLVQTYGGGNLDQNGVERHPEAIGKAFMSQTLQSDPYYRQAWDQIVKAQGGNSQNIDPKILEAQLRAALNSGQGANGGAGGIGYGSLLKPFGMDDFQASPAYQFNLDQGTQALNKAAASRGQYYAPATLQGIAKYSQGLASNEFQNAYSNYNTNLGNIWNRLSTISGGGQNAAANLGTNASQVAGQIGSNQIGAANATAAGQVGAANAMNSGGANAYNAYLTQQILGQNQQSSVAPVQEQVPGQFSTGNPAYG